MTILIKNKMILNIQFHFKFIAEKANGQTLIKGIILINIIDTAKKIIEMKL